MQTKRSWIRGGCLIVVFGLCAGIQPAAAQYTLLHSFAGTPSDGSNPWGLGTLTLSGSTLYGMTSDGGSSDDGVVFKINSDGTGYTILHNFTYETGDGANPKGSLTLSGSTLYGMTSWGGGGVAGTIFKINCDGTGYTTLHDFIDGAGGPLGSLTLSGSMLYGMTSAGGNSAKGAVFKINCDGTGYAILHHFTSGAGEYGDGGQPWGSLALSGSTLYGMTHLGGSSGHGTIFKINTDGDGYTILHNFAGVAGNDGRWPFGSLTLSGSTLYGMTSEGGSEDGAGMVFKINTDGTGYTILHNFTGGFVGDNGDGGNPSGSLTLSGSTLYGMANGGKYGFGIVFKMNTDGTGYTIIRNFGGGSADGSSPAGDLTLSGSTLYGMTREGGSGNNGVVFALVRPGPTIKANGATGDVAVNYPEAVSVTVEMYAGDYAGVPVDWWMIALAGSSWFYLNTTGQWTPFDGNLSNCRPVYQGGLFNLPATEVLNYTGLPVGAYTFWFAVDYPMDGILDPNGQILFDSVTVTVQ